MKSIFHKILSTLLAVLVFVSMTSFIMDAHFCGDSLVDLAIIQQADACGMEHIPNSNDCDSNIEKSSCCKDIQVLCQGQDQVQLTSMDLTIEQQLIVTTFVTSYLNLFEGLDLNIIPFRDYRPPILTWDLQKVQETYLI